MALVVLRCLFVVVAVGVGLFLFGNLAVNDSSGQEVLAAPWIRWGILLGTPLLALAFVAVDAAFRNKRVDTISAVYFGLLVGTLLAYIGGNALTPFLAISDPESIAPVRAAVQLVLAVFFCYLCISLLLQTRNDFRFIIPYIEFSKEIKGLRPMILDTSVVIDGRIADVIETNAFDNQLIMPRFAITELQGIADSSDRMRRSRGRRGLDILNRLRNNDDVDLEIYDHELPEFAGQSVDLKLVVLAKHLEGKLVTNDYNLNKVARLHGVGVINLNDLANALKPVFLPGEQVEVRVVKIGEGPGQGVGYLDDGTMVVIEEGRDYVGRNVLLSVTSVLQTSAGRMVFGRFESPADDKASS